ncbi:MAG TPA: type II toxin-antitoxin system VapC family toxin [Acidobacteriaceae bacterium]|jgi:PIN domain nuclease of toxin-antitoxin system
MNGYLLDTHAWLWVQRGERNELSPAFVGELEQYQRRGEVFVSAISILEIARLVASGGFDLGMSVEQFLDEGTADGGFRLLDLSPRILIGSTRLPGKLHRNPSDRLLIATARDHGLTLITRDRDILTYARTGHLSARKL